MADAHRIKTQGAYESTMLNNPHYRTVSLPSAALTGADVLTDVSFKGPVIRQDTTTDPATPTVLTTDRESNGNIERILVKFQQTFAPTAASIEAEKPYMVQAHLVISYDKRYATRAQVLRTATGLLTHLCIEESEGAGKNIVRYVNGEL